MPSSAFGGVGGLIGGAIARSGHDVVLLMRPESAATYGGVLTVESAVLGDFEVPVPAATTLTERVDVLWVTPKATHLEGALRLAPADVVGEARVVTLMNGVDHLAVLQQRYEHVIAGAMRVESERLSPGHIRQVSPFVRVELSDGADVVAELVAAGIEAALGPDPVTILWQKLAFLAPLALATTVHDTTLGAVRDGDDFRGCQAETVAVARAEGASIDEAALSALTYGAPPDLRSSMQKDRERSLPLELDAIAGPVLRLGALHGIATPATQRLADALG
jgi:2-dehydropantoate 2-reductase